MCEMGNPLGLPLNALSQILRRFAPQNDKRVGLLPNDGKLSVQSGKIDRG
jgi:hypothetical protein